MRELIRIAIGPILQGFLRLIPDKTERAKAAEQFELQVLGALTGLVAGQLEVNKQEAKHSSVFVAGWRPFIGWVCGFGVAMHYIILPLVVWVAFLFEYDIGSAPKLDTADLIGLLLGMLGLGGMRSYEKRLGVNRDNLE